MNLLVAEAIHEAAGTCRATEQLLVELRGELNDDEREVFDAAVRELVKLLCMRWEWAITGDERVFASSGAIC